MDYFEINDPKDKRMCLLVHGGEHIMSIDENSPETDNKDEDEYTDLIEKVEKDIYLKNRDFIIAFDSTKQEKKRVRR
jgi:hypothetical protein